MRRHTALGSCAAAAILLASCTQDRPTGIGPADLGSEPSLAAAPAAENIPGQYIVRFRDDVQDVAQLAGELVATHGGSLRHVYTHAIKGFSAAIPDAAATALARHPRVLYVEQNQVMRAIGSPQSGATWGIDRIDQENLPLSTTYVYNRTGQGVKVYIIDTGIRKTHNEFDGEYGENRAIHGVNKTTGENPPKPETDSDDCNDHGTHVAGTVGGIAYGVAKATTLVAVRVLSCSGSGGNDGVIAGVDWVTADHQPGQLAAANMSLGGGFSQLLNDAVTNSIIDGVVYSLAAGNGYSNACDGSPASTADPALVVGATNSGDFEADFSDRGPCVDIWAPGVGITSSTKASDVSTAAFSGTSMAAPHVAGAAALYLHANPGWTPTQVYNQMMTDATKGIVKPTDLFNAKPPFVAGQNKLLHTGKILATEPPPAPAAPANLVATADGASEIDLTWGDVASEDGYKIERCSGEAATCASFSEIATVGANVISYSNTGLDGATTYSYRVRAHNAGGNSPFSNVDDATTAAPPPPPDAAPTDLAATRASAPNDQTQIDLQWQQTSTNEDGFKIERCEGVGCSSFGQITTVGANVTTYSNTGLGAGKSYSYRVRAYNAGGNSDYSNTSTATTAAPPAPIARYQYNCGGSKTPPTQSKVCDFDGTSSSNAASYSWNFGDPGSGGANTATGAKPRHLFSKQGTFNVKLKVTSSNGATNEITCAVATGIYGKGVWRTCAP